MPFPSAVNMILRYALSAHPQFHPLVLNGQLVTMDEAYNKYGMVDKLLLNNEDLVEVLEARLF